MRRSNGATLSGPNTSTIRVSIVLYLFSAIPMIGSIALRRIIIIENAVPLTLIFLSP